MDEKIYEQADILDRAADEIMVRGGTTGILIEGRSGRVCLLGALGLAMDMDLDLFDEDDIYKALGPQANGILQKHTGGVKPHFWNDGYSYHDDNGPIHHGYMVYPTDSDRIELLKNAAKDLREQA